MKNNIAILTTKSFWYLPHAKELKNKLTSKGFACKIFFKHENISSKYQIVFMLSYARIVQEEYLTRHAHNIVVHASDLPKGKGWAPYFWQVLEGKKKVPIVLFEATKEMDNGVIYIKDHISLVGTELHDELRTALAKVIERMVLKYVRSFKDLTGKEQKGTSTYYRKRNAQDSELAMNKTIQDQFNLLRVVNNEEFPAFFFYKGCKYILSIRKAEPE